MTTNTLKNREHLLKNENYKKYYDKKLEILKNYEQEIFNAGYSRGAHRTQRQKDKYIEFEQEKYREYIKKVCDLMLKPDGDFQKFVWDIMSETDKELMEKRAKGSRDRMIEY